MEFSRRTKGSKGGEGVKAFQMLITESRHSFTCNFWSSNGQLEKRRYAVSDLFFATQTQYHVTSESLILESAS